MNCVIMYKSLSINTVTLFGVALVWLFTANIVMAQTDPFGAVDLVYVDSVQAAPGQDVTVAFNITNDEKLSSFSVPVLYDTSLLTLQSVSFENSRAGHIAYRIITPEDISSVNGHFLVTVLKVFEDPIDPGDGPLFFLNFTVSESAVVGQVAIIDTLFYPPGGSLLLADDSLNQGIVPEFESGMVVIREHNRQPEIQPVPDQYVLEGDSLVVNLSAYDPDGDPLLLALTSKPTGATFVDNGDGTGRFVWRPEFVGPFSADGSPYTVGFWVTDGDLSSERSIEVDVINKNRRPIITHPEGLTIDAGDDLEFGISAVDPDFETIVWQINGLPEGARFDNGNPGNISWTSTLADSGQYSLEIIAADPHGYADTGRVLINVRSATVWSLTLDTVAAYPNETISFDITLDNQLPIGSFNLLVNYDASALAALEVTNLETRSEQFEYFSVTFDANGSVGDIRVVGIVDQSGALNLESGSGPVATIRFLVSGELAFVGMDIPVRFRFLDGFTKDDNTMTDENGEKITQEEIAYANGVVRIRDFGQINIGDINLNGLAYEISDAIYFTNYFMDPLLYSFDPLQFANSDVNRDNIAATVADLVTLINIVVNGSPSPRLAAAAEPTARVTTRTESQTLILSYESELPLGGLRITFDAENEIDFSSIEFTQSQMIYDCRVENSEIRLLVYSMDNQSMPAGHHDILRISGDIQFEIKEIDLSTDGGQVVTVSLGNPVNLVPENFVLHQNYPNPFNPETNISFELPSASRVELDIFNILGRRIATLVNGNLPAGRHTVIWDGRNAENSSVASGVYFYRLSTSAKVETKKMILMK